MKLLTLALFLSFQTFALGVTDSKNLSHYIVGGNDARPEQFPYLVSMRRTIERRHICGGAIVNVRWILTVCCVKKQFLVQKYLKTFIFKAAHCIAMNNINSPNDFVNVVGTVSATSDDGYWYETLRYILHPDWSSAIIRHE